MPTWQLVFYAGHGIEVAGENWLLPVDTALTREADVNTEAITLRQAMLSVSNAKTLGLVILDACRTMPSRMSAGWTRRVRRTAGLHRSILSRTCLSPMRLVTEPRRDGTGRNSPFTDALLHHLETPGLEIKSCSETCATTCGPRPTESSSRSSTGRSRRTRSISRTRWLRPRLRQTDRRPPRMRSTQAT